MSTETKSEPIPCSGVGVLAIIIMLALFFGLGPFLNWIIPA